MEIVLKGKQGEGKSRLAIMIRNTFFTSGEFKFIPIFITIQDIEQTFNKAEPNTVFILDSLTKKQYKTAKKKFKWHAKHSGKNISIIYVVQSKN